MERLYHEYKDRMGFLLVYIREAHPDTTLEVIGAGGSPARQVVGQTASEAARLKNLRHCAGILGLSMPAAVDNADNAASRAYAAWPVRLFVIDVAGNIAFKGNRSWSGFRVQDLETWLQNHVAETLVPEPVKRSNAARYYRARLAAQPRVRLVHQRGDRLPDRRPGHRERVSLSVAALRPRVAS